MYSTPSWNFHVKPLSMVPEVTVLFVSERNEDDSSDAVSAIAVTGNTEMKNAAVRIIAIIFLNL